MENNQPIQNQNSELNSTQNPPQSPKRLWSKPITVCVITVLLLIGTLALYKFLNQSQKTIPQSSQTTNENNEQLSPQPTVGQMNSKLNPAPSDTPPQQCKPWSSAGIVTSAGYGEFIAVDVAGQTIVIHYTENGKKNYIDNSIHQNDTVKITQTVNCMYYVEKFGL